MSEKNFEVKDSGKRMEFDSGMVRDTPEGKVNFLRILDGPMLDRWAAHLEKGAVKYPDDPDGRANWLKANGPAELRRFQASALRHTLQWVRGDEDEDHAAAVMFNINGAEYVKERMRCESQSDSSAPDVGVIKQSFPPGWDRYKWARYKRMMWLDGKGKERRTPAEERELEALMRELVG